MINLKKGEKVSIKGMTFVKAGLGWDINKYDNGSDFDLDASCFLLDETGKITKDEDLVFYNNPSHPSCAVKHSGDNITGNGSGDDESIYIDFSKVPSNIKRISFVVTIHEAETRKQNFGQINNAYIRLCKLNNASDLEGTEELRFDLTEDYSTSTSIKVAEVYLHNDEWKFAAKGEGSSKGLEFFVKEFGGSC